MCLPLSLKCLSRTKAVSSVEAEMFLLSSEISQAELVLLVSYWIFLFKKLPLLVWSILANPARNNGNKAHLKFKIK